MPDGPEKPPTEHRPEEPAPRNRRDTIMLVLLMVYVILLLIGTIGNQFEIDAITSFWLYR